MNCESSVITKGVNSVIACLLQGIGDGFVILEVLTDGELFKEFDCILKSTEKVSNYMVALRDGSVKDQVRLFLLSSCLRYIEEPRPSTQTRLLLSSSFHKFLKILRRVPAELLLNDKGQDNLFEQCQICLVLLVHSISLDSFYGIEKHLWTALLSTSGYGSCDGYTFCPPIIHSNSKPNLGAELIGKSGFQNVEDCTDSMFQVFLLEFLSRLPIEIHFHYVYNLIPNMIKSLEHHSSILLEKLAHISFTLITSISLIQPNHFNQQANIGILNSIGTSLSIERNATIPSLGPLKIIYYQFSGCNGILWPTLKSNDLSLLISSLHSILTTTLILSDDDSGKTPEKHALFKCLYLFVAPTKSLQDYIDTNQSLGSTNITKIASQQTRECLEQLEKISLQLLKEICGVITHLFNGNEPTAQVRRTIFLIAIFN